MIYLHEQNNNIDKFASTQVSDNKSFSFKENLESRTKNYWKKII